MLGIDGEPTQQEIAKWWNWDKMEDHLAIRHQCPCCGGRRTRWVRHEWNICYDCEIAFTFDDLEEYVDQDRITEYNKLLMAEGEHNHEAMEWEEMARRFQP